MKQNNAGRQVKCKVFIKHKGEQNTITNIYILAEYMGNCGSIYTHRVNWTQVNTRQINTGIGWGTTGHN